MSSIIQSTELNDLNTLPIELPEINLRWDNISVVIDKASGRCALDSISGYARPGRILALMGPSSSGKTTLINILSGRPLSRQLIFDSNKGHIYINKQKITDNHILVEQCGYVEQPNELGPLIESITVREHLVFQAMLRLPVTVSDTERYNRINFLIKKLRLTNCENTIIKRLSGGEARRVSLVSCLLTNPSILLIDDLNSGLDSHLALSLMNHIRSLNKTAIVVLHQPSIRLMKHIDDICLLGLNGRMLYAGPYANALSVFYTRCPNDINPADFFLEQAANARPTNPVVKAIKCETILQEQLDVIRKTTDDNALLLHKSTVSYHSNFFRQIYWLLWRSLSFRDVKRLAYLLAQSLAIAVIYGLLDFGVERHLATQTTVQNVAGLVFRILTIVTRVCSLLVIATSPIDHDLLKRESKQQELYSILAYYTSKCIADSPIFIVMVFFFSIIVTALTGLRHFFRQCAVFVLATLCSTALGCLVSASMREKDTRLIIWMPISQIISTVSGFYINTRSIPYMLKWIQYLSLYYYSFSLSLICQWEDVDYIACGLTSSNTTNVKCNNDGDDVLFSYNIKKDDESFYWRMLLTLTILFHVVSYLVILIKLKR
ncbi:unnamed protein product [Adineta steineri]|uniref:ABC transporter domain-containing protein n=1 Tax=Adineta steineri TaxID=433720 RepID=A0A813TBV5_9BILA|nr:unnamed protein product [Adineta steineri]